MPEPAFREMQHKSRNVLKQYRRAKPSAFFVISRTYCRFYPRSDLVITSYSLHYTKLYDSDWNKDLKIKFTVQDPCQLVRKSFGDLV